MTSVVEATVSGPPGNGLEVRPEKNQAARDLLKQWLEDTSGYDEEAWPIVKRVLEENRMSVRTRFEN